MADIDPIAQVRKLQEVAREAATRRTTAEAHRDQAATQLAEILAANNVATVEELHALATEAQQKAASALQAAATALGVTL